MNPPPHENSTEAGIIRQQVSLLVDEVSTLSRGDLPPQEFHREALHRAVRATNALQASLWLNSADLELSSSNVVSQNSEQNQSALEAERSEFRVAPAICVCTVAADAATADASWMSDGSWQNTVVATALNAGKIQHVSPGSGSNRQISMNPTDCFVVAVPFHIEAGSGGAMVMIYDQSSKPAFLQGAAQVVTVFCELIGDYHRNQCLLELRRQQRQWRFLVSFRQELLAVDDLPSLVWSGTNAARRVLNCDRVSLLIRHGRTWQLRCVSGVDTIDRRSTSVKMLERLANQTPDGHQSIWLDGSDSEVACDPSESRLSTDSPAARYRNNTGANVLGILPLSDMGLLVVEQFAGPDGAELQHAAEQIANELTPLLILLHGADQLPLISLSRFLNRRGLQGWRSLSSGRWLLFVIAAGLLAMVLCWPADFEVEARGELQPAEQQFVYAPRDGVVTGFPAAAAASGTAAMRAEQDHIVHTGQVVMQLQNSGLDYQITQILGEQQTTSRRLDTVTVLLEQLARSANPDQSQFSQLTAEKLELEIQQESLLRQLEILRAERQALAITANISGEIQTWDFVSRLRSRPVRQGSHLMTIANVEGAWRLELQIPDRSMTDIHAAQKQLGEELRIRFLVRSAPDQHFTTQLSRLAKTTRYADSHGLSVQAVAELNRTAVPPNARPGTAVVARIYCGQRSLAFVWLHDLVRTVRQRLLL